jgi:hypothetical protein
MIYVINAEGTDWYKIGYTGGAIKVRLQSLQTGNPRKLRCIFCVEGNLLHERVLHERFSSRRVNGEWFELSRDDLETIADEKWYEDYVNAPCFFYKQGHSDPCGCGQNNCLFCGEAEVDIEEFM